jgi:O-antigen/teichoic acid export membrane protein
MLKRLIGHSFVYTAVNLVSRGTMVLALIILPFFLAPDEYGALGMFIAIAALINVTIPLEVSQGLARFHATAEPDARPALSSTAWYFSLATLALFAAAAFLMAEPLCRIVLGDMRFLGSFRLAILYFVLSALFYFLQNQCRWEFYTRAYVQISVLQGVLTLVLSVALAASLESPLHGVVIGHAIGAGIAVALGAVLLRRSLWSRPKAENLRKMLAFSMPLVPGSLAFFASIYASRMILNGMADLDEVGIYTFASQIANLPTIVVIGVQAALTPLIVAHHHEPETPPAIARLFEGFVAIAVLAFLGIGFVTPELILHFGNPDYAPAGPLVLLLAPAYLMLFMPIFAPGFLIAKRTVLQMWVSIAGGFACIVASYLLIAPFGIIGAAIANLAAAAFFLLLWFRISQSLFHIPIRWRSVAGVVAVAAAVAGAASVLDPAAPAVTIPLKLGLLVVAAASIPLFGLVSLQTLRGQIAPLLRRAAWRSE